MYAIIRDRGRQYRVSAGDNVNVDLMGEVNPGAPVTFEEVLLTSDEQGGVAVGQPLVAGAKVAATVVDPEVKGKKIDVVHFRRRKDSMSKVGHRQRYTRVKIESIEV